MEPTQTAPRPGEGRAQVFSAAGSVGDGQFSPRARARFGWHGCLAIVVWVAGMALVQAQSNRKLWEFTLREAIHTSAAIGADGALYFAAQDGFLYALNANGTQRWKAWVGEDPTSAALGAEDTVYVASRDGFLVAVKANGLEQWQYPAEARIQSSPAVGVDGTIFFGAQDGRVHAVTPAGSRRWAFLSDGDVVSSPALDNQGNVLFGTRAGTLYALRPDGSVRWTFTAAGEITGSPAVGAGSVVYFGAADERLYAIGPGGQRLWDYHTERAIRGSPAVGLDGRIYLAGIDGRFWAINADGTLDWVANLDTTIGTSSPALASDGVLYVGAGANQFLALNPDGTRRWTFLGLADFTYGSPVIGADGTVYIGCADGRLYALSGTSGPARGAWPMFRRDARHTASGFVEREIPDTYSPGREMVVTLRATPPATIGTFLVEDTPPANWTVSDLTHGGYFDSASRRVRFGPFRDGLWRDLTYRVTPPLTASGSALFTGNSNADGTDRLVSGGHPVSYVPLHPADNSDVDAWLTVGELTAYGAAWKRGSTWPLAPSPIPAVYLTRAVELWMGGEFYQYDTNHSAPPGWWTLPVQLPPGEQPPDPPEPGSTTPNGRAESRLPFAYAAGSQVQVELRVVPATNVVAQAVEDQPPAGWQVSAISHGGLFDSQRGKVKWGPFFDATPRLLSYRVSVPLAATNTVEFKGTAAFDNGRAAVDGQRQVRPASAGWPAVVAARRLPEAYLPGAQMTVELEVAAWPAGTVLFLEDKPPADWDVGDIAGGGLYDASTGTVKFGPFTDGAARILRYAVSPPAAALDREEFDGTFTLEGVPGLILGAFELDAMPLHPADLEVADGWLTVGELTAYGNAWKRGASWPRPPAQIPTPYLDQARLLWLSGEAYHYDTNAGSGALAWVPLSPGGSPVLPNATVLDPGTVATNGTASSDLPIDAALGQTVTVTLEVTPATNVVVYAVEDQPPDGWAVRSVGNGGVSDTARSPAKVKWGPFFDAQPRTLAYTVQAGATTNGVADFHGVAAFDASQGEVGGLRRVFVQEPGPPRYFVRRTLPLGYAPGAPIEVRLTASPPSGTRYYVVEDTPPAGWAVGPVYDGGFYDATARVVRFGPFLNAAERSLRYVTTPPAGQTGLQLFEGVALLNDLESVIAGDYALELYPLHPADLQPVDAWVGIRELTAYAAAWKRGSAWAVAPSPIPPSYLVNAVDLWSHGEGYRWDSNLAEPPDWWVNQTNAVALDELPVAIPAAAMTTNGTASADVPKYFQADRPLTVTLKVAPSTNLVVYTVEDLPPEGWAVLVDTISAGGFYDERTHKVKWGPFFEFSSAPVTLSYDVVSPALPDPAAVFRGGGAAFDNTAAAFTGRRQTFLESNPPIPYFTNQVEYVPGLGARLELVGVPREVYAIQASTNLESWVTLTVLTNSTGTLLYLDARATNLLGRYYRAEWR